MLPRIFVPYTNLQEQTCAALLGQAEFVLLEDDDYAYGRYLQKRWKEGLTFINVEHDVVPTQEIIRSLWECANPLCAAYYLNVGQPSIDGRPVEMPSSLGCAKISAEYIKTHPDFAWTGILWNQCDQVIQDLVQFTPPQHCVHDRVIHLHKFPF